MDMNLNYTPLCNRRLTEVQVDMNLNYQATEGLSSEELQTSVEQRRGDHFVPNTPPQTNTPQLQRAAWNIDPSNSDDGLSWNVSETSTGGSLPTEADNNMELPAPAVASPETSWKGRHVLMNFLEQGSRRDTTELHLGGNHEKSYHNQRISEVGRSSCSRLGIIKDVSALGKVDPSRANLFLAGCCTIPLPSDINPRLDSLLKSDADVCLELNIGRGSSSRGPHRLQGQKENNFPPRRTRSTSSQKADQITYDATVESFPSGWRLKEAGAGDEKVVGMLPTETVSVGALDQLESDHRRTSTLSLFADDSSSSTLIVAAGPDHAENKDVCSSSVLVRPETLITTPLSAQLDRRLAAVRVHDEPHAAYSRACSAERALPYATLGAFPLRHWYESDDHAGRLISTGRLLQAAFPKKPNRETNIHGLIREHAISSATYSGQYSELASATSRVPASHGKLQCLTSDPVEDHSDKDDYRDAPAVEGELFLKLQGLSKALSNEIPSIHEKTLVEFLRAKKQNKEHCLDKLVVNVDVYQRHPWHYTSGDVQGSFYFCCVTKYSRRGNMTRDRMTKEGGRWKQQGMVQPILSTARGYDAASKTYLSYIPRGKNNSKGYFIPTTPGRVKHRHRMIEIALEEDLKAEKRYLKLKVTPKPFLVVCVLRKT